ncbi:MAG: carbohydrate ABC transporter permease [bacterium]
MTTSSIPFWETKRFRQIVYKTILYIIITIGGFIFMIPFFWMLSTALKDGKMVFIIPPQWIPNPPHWDNFIKGWTKWPFTMYLKNTLIIIVFSIMGRLLSASMVAFGFSRLRFPGRDILFFVLISTMMLPGQVTMIPLYIIYRSLRWIDTFKPLIVPSWFGGGAFFIFLLRQFLLTIPLEMDDAAKIDGCSSFGIYWRIMLPLVKPALGTVAIFSFMWEWNDFFTPLVYLNSMEKRTLALGLAAFSQETMFRQGAWELIMAVSTLVMLPCLIIFFLAQRQFIQGVVVTGVKG